MADVVGISDISWYYHLTGPHRKIQTPQNSCKNLKCEQKCVIFHVRMSHKPMFSDRSGEDILSVTHWLKASFETWCKSHPISDREQQQQGNSIVCFSDKQQWPWNTWPWAKMTKVWKSVPQTSKQTSYWYSGWWKGVIHKKMETNLWNIIVPVNVANVVISQASKQIDQMLQRCRTACYIRKQCQTVPLYNKAPIKNTLTVH